MFRLVRVHPYRSLLYGNLDKSRYIAILIEIHYRIFRAFALHALTDDAYDTLVKAATGKEAKGIGDVIKGYEKIIEIIGHDPMEDGSGLTVRELSRLSDEQLQSMLERLSK